MSETRSGETVSAQIGKMGAIDNLNNADFSLPEWMMGILSKHSLIVGGIPK